MSQNRVTFTVRNKDNEEVKLAIVKPNNRINQDATMAYNIKMAQLIKRGADNLNERLLLRSELEEYLTKTGVWTLRDQAEIEQLALDIRAGEEMLKKGGKKLSEARAIALNMATKRHMIFEKHSKRLQFDAATVEAQAENYRFEIMLINCLVFDDNGQRVIKTHTEYLDRQDEEAVIEGARILANMVYGLGEQNTDKMYELKWLKQAGMVDKEGKYVAKDGKRIDRDGRFINEQGQYVNKDGQLIDILGRRIDDDGGIIIEDSEPFIDDETGEPIIVDGIGEKKKKPIRKRATKKKTTRKKKVGSK